MNKKAKTLGGVLMVLVLFSLLIVNYYFKYKENNFSCRGKMNVTKWGADYSSSMEFDFKDGKGKFYSIGQFNDADNKNKKVIIHFNFTYMYHNKNDVVLVSSEGIKNSELVALLSPLLPDFFLTKQRGIIFEIHRQNSSYVFINDNMPYLLCSRK
ncbi:hypothetical protein [Serratia fonticola]|jgi:hypothetical protein|uniref:hypothetical protein n=1 Tax=Serratia fonticola TaxID=47917 RepID=UPI0021B800BA|nr:hypothetical protein [Serratia fonticola]